MSKPLDYFKYVSGELSVDGIRLGEVVRKTGTPVYIYSAEAFLTPLRALQKGLSGMDALICFAVKANSNLSILKLLGEAGAGMDLVSGGELFRVQKAKVPSNRIVFSGVGKTREEILHALKSDIFSFNVESLPELELLHELAAASGKRAPVLLRFNPDVNAKTHPYISTGLKKNKFGLDRAEILGLLPRLKSLHGVHLHGISMHIGSQLLSLAPIEASFVKIKQLVREVSPHLREPLEVLDLGGGVGIDYELGKAFHPKIATYCKLIRKHFGPGTEFSKFKIVLEPGRILAGNSGVLVSAILFRKTRKNKDFLIVDAAMNDLMRPALYGSFHDLLPLKKTTGPNRKTDIVGPVCESSDCFASDRLLSARLQTGDLLAILSSGAYGFTMASNYNSRPKPPEVLIQNGKVSVIRKRETYTDLVRGEEIV